jgi:hypothetical protein
MELIKKTILLATTTGTTTGCTHCYVIIPDLTALYHFKIQLSQNLLDCAFFDAYEYDGDLTGTTINNVTYTITGECQSRLSELKKFSQSSYFANQYLGNGSFINDGVDYLNSIQNMKVVYYIGGIRYIDNINGDTTKTTFYFTRTGFSDLDFINKPIIKNSNKDRIISNPKINNDVFIARQELSAFLDNSKLEYFDKLVDLETYAGGKYFYMIDNS